MAYGSVLTDTVQSSTAATAPVFKDGNGTQIGTLCRAWVNFNGTGTVAIRASFNVSSITDNGTGDYTVNFTTALPDTNYAISGVAATTTYAVYSVCPLGASGAYASTTACRVAVGYTNLGVNFTNADNDSVSVAIFR